MSYRTCMFCLPVLAVLAMLDPRCQAQRNSSFIELFDGKSLTNWQGDLDYWRVENGSIVGEIAAGTRLAKNTWLVWREGELSDFELRLRFKLTGSATSNSGIQFRCQVTDVDHVSGYQADLDQGATWLGRIYDEHGRALLAERGSRVAIAADGSRSMEAFAPAAQFAVLFREQDWNEYRIVAIGERVDVYVNGTLFSSLQDEQRGERDLTGKLALQLHSGPETRVEFRDIRLERLDSQDRRLARLELASSEAKEGEQTVGVAPQSDDGAPLNLDFETGTLRGWTATGDAFAGQPVSQDGIAGRWPGQTSHKQGKYFIGGFETVRDEGIGTLTSPTFTVTHPYASFLIAGGSTAATRAEIIAPAVGAQAWSVVYSAVGENREQMRRVVADLRSLRGTKIAVRLIDESQGGWGHLNFDDFRFHDQPPAPLAGSSVWRSTFNPLLQHLVPNPKALDISLRGSDTAKQMYVPAGFSVELIAAEPQLHQPMAFTFDAAGRLWVAEGYSYPQKRRPGEGLDRILIFSDDDGDGAFEHRKIFISGINLVSGLEVGHGGVWIGAAPQLLFVPDEDGDDQPDAPPQVLLEGFGYADTHETLNSFMWGPDGWLYGNQGVFNTSRIGKPGSADSERLQMSAGVWRYHPTRHVFEVFAHGGSNQWGLDFDEHGQIFMTHCRSFWGRGPTTHVMQGGHYWNQVNRGYAPFISSMAAPRLPGMRNYMLASARYGHGEGGAGKPGSREVYGGHSHVGTMVYLGDNWPTQYRNHLFTHNLHGHQMNHQRNEREFGGYNTVHAGFDMLFCADQQYIGVDLQVGPDGAVYISDWYDPRNCHNPNVELWDRGNGRIYRLQYDATFNPVRVDYVHASDAELIAAQLHPNDWHARTARRVIGERFVAGKLGLDVARQLAELATEHSQATVRLRAAWASHVAGGLNRPLVEQLLRDESEYVRGWAIQLAVESLGGEQAGPLLIRHCEHELSLLVRRYLAAAIQRLPDTLAWQLAESMSLKSDNDLDQNLPLQLWYGIAGLMERDLDRGLRLSAVSRTNAIRDYAQWYAAKISSHGREALLERLKNAAPEQRMRLLQILELSVRDMRGLEAPATWTSIANQLYDSVDDDARRAAQRVGAVFGDAALFDRMRRTLDSRADPISTRQAIDILSYDSSPQNVDYFLRLLDDPQMTANVLPLLSRHDSPGLTEKLIERLPEWSGADSAAAMEVLSSRVSSAEKLMDAIAGGRIGKERLTAYYAQQISNLGDSRLNARLATEWGSVSGTSAELRAEIAQTTGAYLAAPLWAYSAQDGAAHFKRLCGACHQPNQADERIAPKLDGSGSKGIHYLIENVIDPNAVIGRDFQARLVLMTNAQIVTGLVLSESDSAITLRTATSTVTISKDEIDQIRISANSFMPTGLLESLNERERIELFKYLMSL